MAQHWQKFFCPEPSPGCYGLLGVPQGIGCGPNTSWCLFSPWTSLVSWLVLHGRSPHDRAESYESLCTTESLPIQPPVLVLSSAPVTCSSFILAGIKFLCHLLKWISRRSLSELCCTSFTMHHQAAVHCGPLLLGWLSLKGPLLHILPSALNPVHHTQ